MAEEEYAEEGELTEEEEEELLEWLSTEPRPEDLPEGEEWWADIPRDQLLDTFRLLPEDQQSQIFTEMFHRREVPGTLTYLRRQKGIEIEKIGDANIPILPENTINSESVKDIIATYKSSIVPKHPEELSFEEINTLADSIAFHSVRRNLEKNYNVSEPILKGLNDEISNLAGTLMTNPAEAESARQEIALSLLNTSPRAAWAYSKTLSPEPREQMAYKVLQRIGFTPSWALTKGGISTRQALSRVTPPVTPGVISSFPEERAKEWPQLEAYLEKISKQARAASRGYSDLEKAWALEAQRAIRKTSFPVPLGEIIPTEEYRKRGVESLEKGWEQLVASIRRKRKREEEMRGGRPHGRIIL